MKEGKLICNNLTVLVFAPGGADINEDSPAKGLELSRIASLWLDSACTERILSSASLPIFRPWGFTSVGLGVKTQPAKLTSLLTFKGVPCLLYPETDEPWKPVFFTAPQSRLPLVSPTSMRQYVRILIGWDPQPVPGFPAYPSGGVVSSTANLGSLLFPLT